MNVTLNICSSLSDIYLSVWWRASLWAFVLGGLHQVSVQQYSSCPSNPGLMQDREGGYTRARPVRQNPVYSSLSFFHSFFLSFIGLNVMAQTARLTEQRPKRNGPTGGGHCASLAYWSFHMDSYSSPFGERKTLYLHCAMALYKTGFRATHNGVLCLSLKGHKWQGEEKKVECEILFFFFFILRRTWWWC